MSTRPSGDLTYLEAPDVFVCRSCASVAVSAVPESCPECGEAPGVFRRFQGIFKGDNAAPEDPGALIDLLDSNARWLESLVSDLEEADCIRRPLDGRWCIRDHVPHFYDAQAVPYETATDIGARPARTRDILARYVDERKSLTDRLRGLGLGAPWKCGRHFSKGAAQDHHDRRGDLTH
ncbi:MAG: hypothetical protein JW820_06615 [Spirochaetales bacterium]|nr:hypothetical protein [Spirochaetales bacterium]